MNVKAERDRRGWSRRQLSDVTGLSQYRIGQLEVDGVRPSPDEWNVLGRAFGASGDDVQPDPGASTAAPVVDRNSPDYDRLMKIQRIQRETPAGAKREVEWCGLRLDDVVNVVGEDGTFRFRFHHVDDRQEYVELVDQRSGGTRCVLPNRVVDGKGRRFST